MIHVSTLEAVRQIMKPPNQIVQNIRRKSILYHLTQEDNDIIYPPSVYEKSNIDEKSNEDINTLNHDILTKFWKRKNFKFKHVKIIL